MIKSLQKISEKDLASYFAKHEITAVEKLDMMYFKCIVTGIGVYAMRSPNFTIINDLDIITNNVYKDIVDFVNDVIKPKAPEILQEFGECNIGFFYSPIPQSKYINYVSIPEKTFILSDVHLFNYNDFLGEGINAELFDNKVLDRPIMKENIILSEEQIEALRKFKNDANTTFALADSNFKIDIVNKLTDNAPSFSGLPIKDIEGVIFKCNMHKTNALTYQVIINNPIHEVDKSTTKIYRDIVMLNFIRFLQLRENDKSDVIFNMINSKASYLDTVCIMFMEYMNNNSMLRTYKIEENDLLPPHVGYMGDVEIDMIPNNTVRLMCKYDAVAKNIFRLLVHSLKNVKFKVRKEDDPDEIIDVGDESYLNEKVISKMNKTKYVQETDRLMYYLKTPKFSSN